MKVINLNLKLHHRFYPYSSTAQRQTQNQKRQKRTSRSLEYNADNHCGKVWKMISRLTLSLSEHFTRPQLQPNPQFEN